MSKSVAGLRNQMVPHNIGGAKRELMQEGERERDVCRIGVNKGG